MANVDLAEVDPVCGMKVQPQDGYSLGRARGQHLVFLLRRMPDKVRRPPQPSMTARSRPFWCL